MYLIHGNDLAVASTSGSTLDTESRTLARLTHARKGGTAQMCTESLCETDRRRRLAFTERGWRDTTAMSVYITFSPVERLTPR